MPLIDYSVNIKKDRAVVFGEYYRDISMCFNPPNKTEVKYLSDKSMTKIKNYINLLIDCSIEKEIYVRKENRRFKYKVGFMTLTLPEKQKHTDKEIHENIFKPFIRILKQKYDLAEYLWKAESQDNNNIHYHLTINVWIHYGAINREWNKQLMKAGYNFKTPNHERATTQIKATKSIKNLSAYLCKYISKKDIYKNKALKFIKSIRNKNELCTHLPDGWFIDGGDYRKRKINMRLWDCSNNLKNKKLTLKFVLRDYNKIFSEMIKISNAEIQRDFFSIWLFDNDLREKTELLKPLYDKFIDGVRMEGKQSEYLEIETIF